MTEYLAQVVQQGERYRVAIIPVSQGGNSPIVAAAWAEQDGHVFEASSRSEADAFIGQMSSKYWSANDVLQTQTAAPTSTPAGKAKSKR